MSERQENVGRSAYVWLGVAVFLLAVFVRGMYLYDSSDNPTFRAPIVDSMTYDQLARDLVKGEPMTERFFWQQFFYPFFLAVVYFFTESSILCAKLVQVLLGGVTCVLTYRLGERIFGRAAGVLAGCMAAVYGPLVFFECELLAAGWATFWAVLLIFLYLKTAEKKSVGICFVLGVCGGLSVITRPNFIPFLAASGVWLIVVWVRERVGVKRLALGLAGIIAGFLVATIPVAVQNYRVTNRFSFLPSTGGLNLYIGNNPDFEAVSIRPGVEWQKIVDLPLKEGLYTPDEHQKFFYAKTVEYMRTQPASFLKAIAWKGVGFFSSREMPGNVDVYLFTKWSRLHGLLTWKIDGFGFPFGVLLPLALIGVFLCWRTVPAAVMLFVILYPASIVLTHIEARYRMPVVVPMCILAAGGLVKIAEMVRKKRWLNVVTACAFCGAAAFLCSVAGPFYAERHLDYEAELYCGLGGSLEERGRIEDAIDAYSKAIGLRADYVGAHHNVGLLLMKRGQAKEAVVHLNKVVKLEPAGSDFHRDLGIGLFMLGRTEDAIGHYHKAIQINPRNGSAHNHLGFALQSKGRLKEATKHHRLAVKIDRDNADAHYNLGIALQLQGKFDEAVNEYTEVLRLKAGSIKAHSNLGVIFAGQGRLDEAVAHFTEALRIRPDSAELHCNLGLALQSQGKVQEAIESYKRALAIEPGNRRAREALEKLKAGETRNH
ncbi:MAG: tetratricopeptide repeat protein [Planctomycetota bacterium]|jgi:tetratricopeptide (TPR) repeat protein